MKNCSPNRNNIDISKYYSIENCECNCHYPDDCDISKKNNMLFKNIHTIHHSVSPLHTNSSSSNHIQSSVNRTKSFNNLQTNMSDGIICVCDNICDCLTFS